MKSQNKIVFIVCLFALVGTKLSYGATLTCQVSVENPAKGNSETVIEKASVKVNEMTTSIEDKTVTLNVDAPNGDKLVYNTTLTASSFGGKPSIALTAGDLTINKLIRIVGMGQDANLLQQGEVPSGAKIGDVLFYNRSQIMYGFGDHLIYHFQCEASK